MTSDGSVFKNYTKFKKQSGNYSNEITGSLEVKFFSSCQICSNLLVKFADKIFLKRKDTNTNNGLF